MFDSPVDWSPYKCVLRKYTVVTLLSFLHNFLSIKYLFFIFYPYSIFFFFLSIQYLFFIFYPYNIFFFFVIATTTECFDCTTTSKYLLILLITKQLIFKQKQKLFLTCFKITGIQGIVIEQLSFKFRSFPSLSKNKQSWAHVLPDCCWQWINYRHNCPLFSTLRKGGTY